MKNFARDTPLIFKMKAYLSIVVFPLFLGGCNTIEGVGTDIKEGGKAIESAAETCKGKDCAPSCPCKSQHSRSRQY